jgi:hypothetical protein
VKIEEVILRGKFVSLVPLRLEHLDALYKADSDESLWLWTTNVVKSKFAAEFYFLQFVRRTRVNRLRESFVHCRQDK